jgi:hypothetical protein
MCVIQGMSTLARDGADREKLLKIVHMTMLSWPQLSSFRPESSYEPQLTGTANFSAHRKRPEQA